MLAVTSMSSKMRLQGYPPVNALYAFGSEVLRVRGLPLDKRWLAMLRGWLRGSVFRLAGLRAFYTAELMTTVANSPSI
jgi:hypothetical protein